jgi:hypothetical protein
LDHQFHREKMQPQKVKYKHRKTPFMKNLPNSESGSKAIFTLFSQLASVVQKTGDVISQLSKNYTDMPELTQAGERVCRYIDCTTMLL